MYRRHFAQLKMLTVKIFDFYKVISSEVGAGTSLDYTH